MATENRVELEPYISSSSSEDDDQEVQSTSISSHNSQQHQLPNTPTSYSASTLLARFKLRPVLLLMSNHQLNPNILVNLSNKFTLLHYACFLNKQNIADILVSKLNANLNVYDNENQTPLHLAVRYSVNSIIYLLASNKECKIDELDSLHCTPLLCAIKTSLMYPFLYLYFEKNADCKVLDVNGCSITHWAAYKNNPKMMSLFKSLELLEIELKDAQGSTPIFRAVQSNSEKAVKYLIKEGANLDVINNDGQTPLQYCRATKKYFELSDVMQKCRAERYIQKRGACSLCSFIKECKPMVGIWCLLCIYFSYLSKITSSMRFIISTIAHDVISLIMIYNCIELNTFGNWLLVVSFFTFFFFSKVALYRAKTTPPGYKNKNKVCGSSSTLPMYIDRLRNDYSIENDLCTHCLIVKGANDNHCKECGRCVNGYAFHWDELNVCLGAENSNYYAGWVWFSLIYYSIALYSMVLMMIPKCETSSMFIISAVELPYKIFAEFTKLSLMFGNLSMKVYLLLGNLLKVFASFSRNTSIYNTMHLHKKRDFSNIIEACRSRTLRLKIVTWKTTISCFFRNFFAMLALNFSFHRKAQVIEYSQITNTEARK